MGSWGESAGGEEHAEPVVVAVAAAACEAAVELDDASVPPFDERPVVKYARNASRHRRRVRPSRTISGIGQVWNDSTTFWAIRRPSARSFAW